MKAKCLCESVEIEVEHKDSFDACHCKMCQKWGGGPFLGLDTTKFQVVKGEDKITRYESSEWAQRGFCSSCGTHLFYFLKPRNEYIVTLGLIDNTETLTFESQIFIDKKAANYSFANDTKELTEKEVIELFNL